MRAALLALLLIAGCAHAQPAHRVRQSGAVPEFVTPGTGGTAALGNCTAPYLTTLSGAQFRIETVNPSGAGAPVVPYAVSVASRPGRNAVRFEVRYGDLSCIDDAVTHGYVDRSEADGAQSAGGHVPRFTHTWISYAFLLEPRVSTGAYALGGSINQVHQDVNDLYGACCSPPWDMYLTDNDASLIMEYRLGQSATPPTGNTIAPTVLWHSAPVVRGVWHFVVLHFYPDYTAGGAGQIQMWYDGLKVADYAGPWDFNGSLNDYFKFGIYRGAGHSPEILAIRFANMEIGQTDLRARITAPLWPY